MRSKFTPVYWFAFLIVILYLFIGFASGPPAGKTGAPGDGICSECHTPPSSGQDGVVSINGLPSNIMPGQTYTLTVVSENPNGAAVRAGFQMVVLNSANNNAGSFSNLDPFTATQTSGGRTYWQHDQMPQNYNASDEASWSADWTAPAGPGGDVITIYVANNVANGNGNNQGDLIIQTNVSGTLMGGGDPLQVSVISSSDVSCNGGNDGSATAEASGGAMPYSYEWSNGAMGATADNLSAGVYTVTVTDDASNTATDMVTIDEPAAIQISVTSTTDVSCNGGNDGSATVQASGGTPGYTYNWSNGDSGPTADNLSAGSYTVTVTDNNNCTQTANVQISEPDLLQLIVSETNDVSCNGDSDGSATVQALGGTAPYTYSWPSGNDQATETGLAAGTFTATVSDNNGCLATVDVTINEPDLLELQVNGTNDVTCYGESTGSASVVAFGGTPGYNYSWSNGDSGSSVDGLPAGSYGVTVTDANGCTATTSLDITQPDSIDIEITNQVDPLCAGDSNGQITVSASGGTGTLSYEWSNGDSGPTADMLTAGSYTVTVTDDNGCTMTASVDVNEPDPLVLSMSSSNETAADANDGTATVLANGGTPPYSYLWDTGDTTSIIDSLAAGTYTVTVTDDNGCEAVDSATVAAFGCDLAVDVVVTDLLCNGDSSGMISLAISGANGMATIAWSNGQSSAAIENLPAGTYAVTVSDEAGCEEIIANIEVEEPAVLELVLNNTNETAADAEDGTAEAVVSGGTSPYHYLWNTGDTTAMIDSLPPGFYTVTVTDDNGCTATDSTEVSPFGCDLMLDVGVTDVNCHGESSGLIALQISGATGTVSYQWSTGDTTDALTGIPAGTYAVTVSDEAGCTESVSGIVVAEPDELMANATATDESAAGAMDGTASANPAGGVPPYSYLWNTGDTTAMIDSLAPGTYAVTVTDANDCFAADSVVVNAISCDLELDSALTHVSCAGASDGLICVQAVGGTAPYQYDWSTGASGDSCLTGLEGGSYSVTVTDADNCVVTGDFEISEPDSLQVSATVTDVACYGDTSGSAMLSASGGSPPYDFQWSDGASGSVRGGLGAGTYAFTLTDENGCERTDSVVIAQPDSLSLAIDSISENIPGEMNGAIYITVEGGTSPYSYNWKDPTGADISSDEDLTNVDGGYYSLEVEDANGCSLSQDSILVDEADAVELPGIVERFELYPNPAGAYLQFELELNRPANLRFAILNESGQRVSELKEGPRSDRVDQSIDLKTLPAGYYFLMLELDGERFLVPWIKI